MIKNLFNKIEKSEQNDNSTIYVVALLIEASSIDGQVQEKELIKIKEMVAHYFNINNKTVENYFKDAVDKLRINSSFHNLTSKIHNNYNYKEKLEILEMLWNVVLIDNIEHEFESSLMRRLGGLLHIKDIDNGIVRKKVIKKLDIEL